MPQFVVENSPESTAQIRRILFQPPLGGTQGFQQLPPLEPGQTSAPIQYQPPGGAVGVVYPGADGQPKTKWLVPAISAENEHPVVVVPPVE